MGVVARRIADPTRSPPWIANIDIIDRDGLVKRATHVGDRLSSGLNALMDDGLFTEVRGIGGMWAAQIGGDDAIARGVSMRDRMLDLGLVCRSINGGITFCPPLVIGDDDIDHMVDICRQAVLEYQ